MITMRGFLITNEIRAAVLSYLLFFYMGLNVVNWMGEWAEGEGGREKGAQPPCVRCKVFPEGFQRRRFGVEGKGGEGTLGTLRPILVSWGNLCAD